MTGCCQPALPFGTRPTRRSSGKLNRSYSGRVTGCLVLQVVGFTLPAPSPAPRCALTAPFHHCLFPWGTSAVYFLWHFPAGRPGWPLATTVPCPARTFLRPASREPATARPTLSIDYLRLIIYYCSAYAHDTMKWGTIPAKISHRREGRHLTTSM